MRLFIITGLTCLLCLNAKAQFSAGASGMLNYGTEAWGVGIRGNYDITPSFAISGRLKYFPDVNVVNEWYGGLVAQYTFYRLSQFDFNVQGGGYFQQWINADEFENDLAQPTSFTPEAGLGVVWTTNCWQPFIESHYNFTWEEMLTEVGIIFRFSCLESNSKYICPTYF